MGRAQHRHFRQIPLLIGSLLEFFLQSFLLFGLRGAMACETKTNTGGHKHECNGALKHMTSFLGRIYCIRPIVYGVWTSNSGISRTGKEAPGPPAAGQ